MRQQGEAERAFCLALDLNPNFALAHARLAASLGVQGAHQEAVDRAEHALWLSPRDRNVGLCLAGAGGCALVSLIGGTSILGRLVLGPIGDRVGVLPLFKTTILLMAISYAIWLLWASYVGLAMFAVMLGVNYGSRIAAVPAVLIELFGVDDLSTMLGVFFTATGLAALLEPMLAGMAVEWSGGYTAGILFALTTGLLGFVAILPVGSKSFGRPPNDQP